MASPPTPTPPTPPLAAAVETFSAPIEDLIVALGQGLAQAQQALDQNSIKTQEAIDTDPVLSQYGLQATWYQFPNVNMQLKMSLSIAQDQQNPPSQVAARGLIAPINAVPLRIIAQPLSASFQSQFNFDASAATQVNLTIVPVPAPASGSQVPPQMTQAQVQTVALASSAPFVTTTDSHGNKIPATTDSKGNALSLIINFNAASRVWYVIQYAPSNNTVPNVVVAVDDATQSVRIISPA
jgi:hypothetical protein